MSELMIEQRTTTADEQHACQQWSVWESGNIEEFNYDYDQDVEFIVQQGAAIIRTTSGEQMAINAGKRVFLRTRRPA